MVLLILLISFSVSLIASVETEAIDVRTFLDGLKADLEKRPFVRPTISVYGDVTDFITVQERGIGSSIHTFKVYDPQCALFAPLSLNRGERSKYYDCHDGGIDVLRAEGGTRTVAMYGNNESWMLCFKHCPELPMMEFATREMFRVFFQDVRDEDIPFPASKLVTMNDEIFLVSKFIQGEPFDKILKNVENDLNQDRLYECRYPFDVPRFQRLAILHFFIAPEDFRPQNCLVRQVENGLYEFVPVDSERGFGREITEGSGTRVHCFLFCFHEMLREPLSRDVYNQVTSSKKRIREVLTELVTEHQYHIALNVQDNRTILDLPVDPGSFVVMFRRIDEFIERLFFYERREISIDLATAFSEVNCSKVAKIYHLDNSLPFLDLPELVAVLGRIWETDPGRIADETPNSANTPLEKYVGTTGYDSELLRELLEYVRRDLVLLDDGERREFIDAIFSLWPNVK